MAWSMDIQGPIGGANLATGVRFKSAALSWTSDGPGSAEIDVLEADISNLWQPGTHRVIVKQDGVPRFAGKLVQLGRSSSPSEGLIYTATALGLAAELDFRIIHKPQVFAAVNTPVADIAWQLIDAVQADQVNGEMGFSQGAVVGTTVSRDRGYCDGSVVGEEIRELASIGRGFDWEIDATGAFNVWNNTRGIDQSGVYAVTPTTANGWEVEADTSDLVTSVSAYGSLEKPWGPQRVPVRTFLADTYGRREYGFDVDTTDEQELEDAGTAELASRGGARVRVHTTWLEGMGPWAFGDVWLQDRVSAELESWFGGTQDVRCTDITVTLDPNPEEVWFVEHTFDGLVEDITTDPEV